MIVDPFSGLSENVDVSVCFGVGNWLECTDLSKRAKVRNSAIVVNNMVSMEPRLSFSFIAVSSCGYLLVSIQAFHISCHN